VPSTSSVAATSSSLQSATDLRIRNSLGTILVQPSSDDIRQNSRIKPPNSGLMQNCFKKHLFSFK